jgi:divalent metal cation (Fe/Co/Zn/Cd) transporter
MKPHHWPWTFLAFTALGIVATIVGVAALLGLMQGTHPLFNDDMAAGLALIVTAIALFLTGGFPLVLRRLAEREGA